MFAREPESGRPVNGRTMHPNAYVAVLTPGATELDRVGERGLQRGDAGKTTSSGLGYVPWGDEPGEGWAGFCRSPGAQRRGQGKLSPSLPGSRAPASGHGPNTCGGLSWCSGLRVTALGTRSPNQSLGAYSIHRPWFPAEPWPPQSSPEQHTAWCCWASPVSPPERTAWPGITWMCSAPLPSRRHPGRFCPSPGEEVHRQTHRSGHDRQGS